MTIIRLLYEVQRRSPTTDAWVVMDAYTDLKQAESTKSWFKSKEPKRKFRIVEKKERIVE